MSERPELDVTAEAPISDPAHTATLQGPARTTSLPSAIDGLALGSQIGHFRIDGKLGAGGMGEVYRATDLALDRPVAIKVLPDGLARDPGRRDRLIREARAQARVVHPNVGHIYFIGEQGGQLYFAMELVAGETLADRVVRGPLAIDDALGMIRGAALGLREAQRSGFTHRDVKPSNLMVDGHGVLKVLDALSPGLGRATVQGRDDRRAGVAPRRRPRHLSGHRCCPLPPSSPTSIPPTMPTPAPIPMPAPAIWTPSVSPAGLSPGAACACVVLIANQTHHRRDSHPTSVPELVTRFR